MVLVSVDNLGLLPHAFCNPNPGIKNPLKRLQSTTFQCNEKKRDTLLLLRSGKSLARCSLESSSLFFLMSSIYVPGHPLRRSARHRLNLNLWQRRRLAAEIRSACVGVLGVVVRDGGFNRILGKHGAVHYISVSNNLPITPHLIYSHLTGGKQSSFAISVFLILAASSSVIPRTNSVK